MHALSEPVSAIPVARYPSGQDIRDANRTVMKMNHEETGKYISGRFIVLKEVSWYAHNVGVNLGSIFEAHSNALSFQSSHC